MIFGLLGSLLTGGISLAKEYIGGKNEEKRLNLQNEQEKIKNAMVVQKAAAEAKAKAMTTRMEGDVAWENIWAEGAKDSWKDEYWTIILSSPLILTMVPSVISCVTDPMAAATYVKAGLDAVTTMPEWYQWGVGASIGASFGYRKITDFFAKKKGI